MRHLLLKDLRLKLFCAVLAVMIWEAIHLAVRDDETFGQQKPRSQTILGPRSGNPTR